MADITTSSDPKTLQTQAEQLAPYMAQAFRQMTRDVATITKWNTGDFDYTQIYSMPVVYYDAASGKTLRIQVLMSAIVKALEDGAKEELTAIKASATEAAESAANSKVAAEAAKTQAEQSAATAAAQKDETISYLNTVKGNEQQRIEAEQERIIEEQTRQRQEQARQSQEEIRVNAETTRVNNEDVRILAEQQRINDENARANAESERELDFIAAKEATEEATANANVATRAANNAASKANSAASNANDKATLANTAASNADNMASLANTAATNANEATLASQKQTESCKSATDLAEELNAHPQMQGSNGNWWKWNTETNEYEDTGIIARGGGMYPMVRSRRNHIIWYDSTDDFKERIVRRRNHTVIKL